jgi:hypothetical protein
MSAPRFGNWHDPRRKRAEPATTRRRRSRVCLRLAVAWAAGRFGINVYRVATMNNRGNGSSTDPSANGG